MTDATTCNPHKEEDEGYLAAEAGSALSANPYPSGTLRYDDWRRGWRIRTEESRRQVRLGEGHGQDDEGYLAAAEGKGLSDNPHPTGTLRYDDWRRGWCVRTHAIQRAVRLGKA
jgi:hypothetical protein